MKVYSQMIGSMHNRFFHFSVSESISGRPHVACLTETIKQQQKKNTNNHTTTMLVLEPADQRF